MKTRDFDYKLPAELIAQTPIEPRDHSRLMVLCRADGSIQHRRFSEIANFLNPGDVLIFNNSRVIPARLLGCRETGGKVEILLLRSEDGIWETLVKPARRLKVGERIKILANKGKGFAETSTYAEVLGRGEEGLRLIQFLPETKLDELGQIPLPPYIHTPLSDPERYQTVYAKVEGSVAAPTAGLHFTTELLDSLQAKGIELMFLTLHVGLDSFRPVRTEEPSQHSIAKEYCELDEEFASKLAIAKAEGRRIICVGTTVVRAVEQTALAEEGQSLKPFKGWASLLILPGHRFRIVDALITNFHLPRTTLLMLVCAFAGKGLIDRAYQQAINSGYRFYSFGDAMLIL